MILRKLVLSDMDEAAGVRRVAFQNTLPWIPELHTIEEDRDFFRARVFAVCQVWGAFDGGAMIGMIAFRDGWIDQLYVRPEAQGCGAGTALLDVAKRAWPELQLWTFQKNARARRFYERRGFVLIRETDGAGNEEKEPDALYRWTRG